MSTTNSVNDGEDDASTACSSSSVLDDRPGTTVSSSTSSSAYETTKPTSTRKATDSSSMQAQQQQQQQLRLAPWTLCVHVTLILLLGLATSAAFLKVGLASVKQKEDDHFERSTTDLMSKLKSAWLDYEYAANFIHYSCRDRTFSRQDFRDLYEYLVGAPDLELNFQAAHFVPHVTHAERAALEQEAREFLQVHHPKVNYSGFFGFNQGQPEIPRRQHPFYYPIQYTEPIVGNEAAIGLDVFDAGVRQRDIMFAIENGLPSLTGRIELVQETTQGAYAVALIHPGVNLPSKRDVWPRDLANVVVRIPDLLQRSLRTHGVSSRVYLYDHVSNPTSPEFLGGIQVDQPQQQEKRFYNAQVIIPQYQEQAVATLTSLPEMEFSILLGEIRHKQRHLVEQIRVANKRWTVVVVIPPAVRWQEESVFVVAGGLVILVAAAVLALWTWSNWHRVARENAAAATAEAEKTALILDGARKAANAERDLVRCH